MAFNGTLTEAINVGGGVSTSNAFTFTGDGRESRQVVVPDSTTDKLVNIAIDIDQMRLIYIVSDQDITLETNNAGTPQETIALKAGKPLVWYLGSYFALPFAGDVTSMYLTNASGSEALFELHMIHDATP